MAVLCSIAWITSSLLSSAQKALRVSLSTAVAYLLNGFLPPVICFDYSVGTMLPVSASSILKYYLF